MSAVIHHMLMPRCRDRNRQPRILPTKIKYKLYVILTAGLYLCLSWGCEPKPPPPPPRQPLPKLSDLEPAVPEHAPPAEARPGLGPLTQLLVRKLMYDADDGRVDLALQMLEEPEIDAELLARWRASGLRMARLKADEWPLLAANLPPPAGSQTSLVLLSGYYTPVTLFAGAGGAQAVLQRDGRGGEQVHRLAGGEYQLLMQITAAPDGSGAPRLDILPHHYKPRVEIIPRSPHEQMMAGFSFTNLQVTAPLPPDQAWLIWSDAEFTRRGGPPARDSTQPPQPMLLGRAMFTGEIGSRPVRLLLILTGAAPASAEDSRTMSP